VGKRPSPTSFLMRAALPALDAASALIDPDGYLWMFGGSNGPGRSAAHPGVHSVGHRPLPSSLPSAVTPKTGPGKDCDTGAQVQSLLHTHAPTYWWDTRVDSAPP
jgi:hypothetical protein